MKPFILLIIIVATIECASIKDLLLKRKAIESARNFWKFLPKSKTFEYTAGSPMAVSNEDLAVLSSSPPKTLKKETRHTASPTTYHTTPTTPTKLTKPTTPSQTTTATSPTTPEPTTTVEPTTTTTPPAPKKPFIKVVFDYLLKIRFEFEVNKNR
ncbi:integumentary mucin A.1-like [Centruroides sculpturatus]|uniref:integumentary mucin A.1-like n=1 Tax=Centruroides sculpturatus TaxID=218467 RepID=UPI000C6D2F7B|nr:integumentary mucin A.1-like [Centruroides sculpturatus]